MALKIQYKNIKIKINMIRKNDSGLNPFTNKVK